MTSSDEKHLLPRTHDTLSNPHVLVPDALRERLRRVATDLCYCAQRLEQKRKREGKLPTKPVSELHDEEITIIDPLLEDGYEIVGTGAGRCVLRFPSDSELHDSVVKLARFGDNMTSLGIVQNHQEVMRWLRHGDTARWPLVPVRDFHRDQYRWLVMPYGETITNNDESDQELMCQAVKNRLRMLPDFDVGRSVPETSSSLTISHYSSIMAVQRVVEKV